MAAAPAMQRITVALAFVAVLVVLAALALLPGDEGGQAPDIALAVAALRLPRLLLVARIGLLLIVTLLLAVRVMLLARLMLLILVVARLERRLRLTLAITGLVLVRLVAVVVEHLVALLAAAFRTHERLLLSLPELLLRRRDEAEIVLGVLVVVFGRNRVAGALRVASELDVFLGDM